MLDTQEFGDYLQSVGLKDFVGVPCSYLAPLINYAINSERFIMSNNEGDAVAIASGISLCRLNGHSACGDFLGNATDASLRRMSNTPHSLTLHNPKNSLKILECQDSSNVDSSNTDSLSLESHANFSNTDSQAEGFFDDFACCADLSVRSYLVGSAEARKSNSSKSTKKPTPCNYGVVLMQNSGLSNALSPLTSLNYTFKIPILGFVSLRGERDSSGKNTDEPQHELLGIITDTLLETCEMKYAFLDSDMDRAKMQVQEALEWLEKGESFFFIVRDKTFSKIALSNAGNSSLSQSLNECGNSARSFASSKLPSPRFAQHSNLSQDTRIADSKSLESQTNPKINTTTLETKDSSNTESKPDSKPTQPANKMPTRLEALSVLHTLARF